MARQKRTVPVLILQDRENLGEVGDVVDVKPGYARNFLLPAGIATLPTADALRQVERAKIAAAAERARRSNFIYGSSKAGLDTFTQGLGDALHGTGCKPLVCRVTERN